MKFSTENEKKESFVETLKRLTGLGKPHHEIHRPNPYQFNYFLNLRNNTEINVI